ncbi:MAG: Glutamate 5-kinase / RNA-binding C-terminal domain PUA, partial [uncultured Ramlibacter sp.]
ECAGRHRHLERRRGPAARRAPHRRQGRLQPGDERGPRAGRRRHWRVVPAAGGARGRWARGDHG